MFAQNGFDVEEVGICNKKVENRSLELVMNRYFFPHLFCQFDVINYGFGCVCMADIKKFSSIRQQLQL